MSLKRITGDKQVTHKKIKSKSNNRIVINQSSSNLRLLASAPKNISYSIMHLNITTYPSLNSDLKNLLAYGMGQEDASNLEQLAFESPKVFWIKLSFYDKQAFNVYYIILLK